MNDCKLAIDYCFFLLYINGYYNDPFHTFSLWDALCH